MKPGISTRLKAIEYVARALVRRAREAAALVMPLIFSIHRNKYFVSHELKIVYLPISKAANSYIKGVLIDALGILINDGPYAVHRSKSVRYLTTNKLPNNIVEYFCFTVVRDPEQRIKSGYANKFKDSSKINRRGFEFSQYCGSIFSLNTSFEEYLKIIRSLPNSARDEHFVDQAFWIYNVHRFNCRLYSVNQIDCLLNDLSMWCAPDYVIDTDVKILNQSEKKLSELIMDSADCWCEADAMLSRIGNE